MHVFVTGATGFIGSHVVPELIAAGHRVTGLSRSEEKGKALAAQGAEVLLGTLEDLEALTRAAAAADGVIHLGFNHDFSQFKANCEADRGIIAALAAGLKGTAKPLVVTSGTGVALDTGGPVTEATPKPSSDVMPRAATEEALDLAAAAGVATTAVRLPQVHDTRRQGFVSYAIMCAQQHGRSAYVGEGKNRWPAAHVSDVARLYRLAVERAQPGAIWNAVAEEGVAVRDIAEVVGQRLNLPVVSLTDEDEVAAHFGWLAPFATLDLPASSALTRRELGWTPTGRGLLADLAELEV